MTEFLTTHKINYHLERLIKDAKEEIVLVSPYLKLNDMIIGLLKHQKRKGIQITIICRENKYMNDIELQYISHDIIVNKNLHAKCYMNESTILLTSLNLYEYSQINNIEMGILLNNDEDSIVMFNEINKEINYIIEQEATINIDNNQNLSVNTKNENITDHEIIIYSVEIVEGYTIKKGWKNKMQKIITNQGIFIDCQIGGVKMVDIEGSSDCDWSEKLGQTLKIREEYNIDIDKYGNKWLRFLDICVFPIFDEDMPF